MTLVPVFCTENDTLPAGAWVTETSQAVSDARTCTGPPPAAPPGGGAVLVHADSALRATTASAAVVAARDLRDIVLLRARIAALVERVGVVGGQAPRSAGAGDAAGAGVARRGRTKSVSTIAT
ncbi:hypothetical protein GCM10023203_09330 [Actinomycetospora straminea]|uniref:Uncharacterized protein n=1 Tax=Actinomycetospora straminea TaxID=663607 RepID=A0ABP9DYT8_9PSEU